MTCKYCGDEKVNWPKPYVQGALMINPDGSEHKCRGKPQQEKIKVDPSELNPLDSPSGDKHEFKVPQAKDFVKMVDQQLFDDGYARAIQKRSLLLGIRKALPTESEPVIGMIFNQICADLRL